MLASFQRSLLCIGRRPDFFKVAVSGAPVTCWEVYDTGYTERYIGTPQEFPAVYDTGSVCKLAPDFPDEPNRVLICHGLIDENVHFTNTVRVPIYALLFLWFFLK